MDLAKKKRILEICSELGEDIDSSNCKALREYVRECPDCRAFVDSVKKTITLYRHHIAAYDSATHGRLFAVLDLNDPGD